MSARAIDVAYDILLVDKSGLTFKELWAKVREKLGYDDKMAIKKASQFYTDLSLDGRFINLEDNTWNLKIHCKYDEVAVADEVVDDSEDEEEEENEDDFDSDSENDEELSEY